MIVVTKYADHTTQSLFTSFTYTGSTFYLQTASLAANLLSHFLDCDVISAPRSFHSVLWLNDTSIAKVSEEGNRKLSARRNTMVQLLALYSDPERYNAQRYRQTDGQTT